MARPAAVRTLVLVAIAATCTCANANRVDFEADGSAMISTEEEPTAMDFVGLAPVDLSAQLADEGLTKGEVHAARVQTLILSVDPTTGASFDFLNAVAFTISAEGLATVVVARLDSVPKGVTELTLAVEPGVELGPYVTAPSLSFQSSSEGSRPAVDTAVTAQVTFEADVDLAGCE